MWFFFGFWGNVGEGVRYSSYFREGGRVVRIRELMFGWSMLVECYFWEFRFIIG